MDEREILSKLVIVINYERSLMQLNLTGVCNARYYGSMLV